MAVVIRFARCGTRGKPVYRIVAADKQFPRDGRYLETLGTYNPKSKSSNIKKDRVEYWMSKGARPSETVGRLIKQSGVL